MGNFDVACLLVHRSGLTITPINLTVTACKASAQALCQAVLMPEVVLMHVHISWCFHRQC